MNSKTSHPYPQSVGKPTLSAIASFKSGGTTGYFSAAYVDKLVDRCGKELHLVVDRVYGLSVGAINAAALWPLRETGKPIHSAKSLRAFYHHHTNDIFDNKFWMQNQRQLKQ